MYNSYPSQKTKKKNLIKRIIETDNKLYKTGVLLAHLYTAMEIAKSAGGGRR